MTDNNITVIQIVSWNVSLLSDLQTCQEIPMYCCITSLGVLKPRKKFPSGVRYVITLTSIRGAQFSMKGSFKVDLQSLATQG